MKKIFEPLYKIDNKGKVRIWYMEQDGERHRTIAGIKDGKLVTSGWTQCEHTNVGRANHRNPTEQATFEIEATYRKNLERDYHATIDGAQGGAHFFEPMLAQKYEAKKFEPGYAQPKLDGIRCIAKADGLWTREGKPIPSVPHITESLKLLFTKYPELILDGELYNHALKDDFNTILSIIRKTKELTEEQIAQSRALAQYHVYDMPSHTGTFPERFRALHELIYGDKPDELVSWFPDLSNSGKFNFLVGTTFVETAEHYDTFHRECIEQGYEGSILRMDGLYEKGKRSKMLLKRKDFIDGEFEIDEILEGNGNWAGCAKAVRFKMPFDVRAESGERPEAGIKGTQDSCRQLLKDKDNYKTATIRYFEITPAGVPRHGVAVAFYEGKRDL